MSARWLVLDTSTPIAVAGVVDLAASASEVRVLAEERITEARRHAEGPLDAIDRALTSSTTPLDTLAGIAVGRGPGSFIGVRTGIATAKGLALGRGVPLVGLPTLVALANSADAASLPAGGGRGLAVVDAKRGEVYVQLVEIDASARSARAVDEPRAMTPAGAVDVAASLAFVVGVGIDAGSERLITLPAPSALGLGRALAMVTRGGARVVNELDGLVPDYCRAPDAKLPAVDPSARRTLV